MRFASLGSKTSIGCCAGDRWRSPISRANGSRRRCCERWSQHAGPSAPMPAHGRPGRVWVGYYRRHGRSAIRSGAVVSRGGLGARGRAGGSGDRLPARRSGTARAWRRLRGETRDERSRAGKRRGDWPRHVVSNADYARLARSCRPDRSGSVVPSEDSQLPIAGRRRQTSTSRRPASQSCSTPTTPPTLTGRIHIGPDVDYLERAFDASKYGGLRRPYLDIGHSSLTDSSLAPDGKHVMSIHVQFAPYKLKQGDWETRREEFSANVVNQMERTRRISEFDPRAG